MATKPITTRQRVHLTFPEKLINEPVLSLLAKQFDVVFNIRGSTVTSEMALVELDFDGKESEIAKAIAWLKRKGVSVEPIGKNEPMSRATAPRRKLTVPKRPLHGAAQPK